MKTAIKREINALNRISQNVINASVNKFDLIPFVYAGPRTADGRRVVYIDALEWYANKSGQPGLMYEECLFPDVWEDLHLRATFRPGDSRIVWEAAYREMRCILGDRTQEGYGGVRTYVLDKVRHLVESELLAEAVV
ncbi:hypothetical protein ACMECQ_000957 [Salmonella enterica]|nr:hypothetical protein [Salmonella enterica]EFT8094340.1 hypothetical protein [Salmonella enterica]EGL7299110.1 hypothetical protein [Salmonella enterica]EHT5676979.1 hypothetical protein [Salmonella enterica]EHZ9567946.1 hypothetical protein [Salmonella enterica]